MPTSTEREYIEALKAAILQSREIRDAADAATAAAMADMARALGSMLSFRAMSSEAFPVAVIDTGRHETADGPPDFGAEVRAIRDARGVSRLTAQASCLEAEFYIEATLHPTRDGTRRWTLSTQVRGFDGRDRDEERACADASEAVHGMRDALLALAVRVASRGTVKGRPVLPDGDEAAARTVTSALGTALRAGAEAAARKEANAAAAAQAAGTARAAWDMAAARLAFMREAGYGFDGDGSRSISSTQTLTGVQVTLRSGDAWSRITAEPAGQDPAIAIVSFEDCWGGTGTLAVRENAPEALAHELAAAAMQEALRLESAFLPDAASHEAPDGAERALAS